MNIFFTSLPRFLVRNNQTHQDRNEESDILVFCFQVKLVGFRLFLFFFFF